MPYWKFKNALDGDGRNLYLKWADTIPSGARDAFDDRFTYLENIERFSRPYATRLKGYKLYEVRVFYKQVQYRAIGIIGPGDRCFTLLGGAIEKGDQFIPKDICKRLSKIAKEIDDSRTCDHE